MDYPLVPVDDVDRPLVPVDDVDMPPVPVGDVLETATMRISVSARCLVEDGAFEGPITM